MQVLIELNPINYISSENMSSKRLFYLDVKGIKLFLHSVLMNYKKQDQLLNECAQIRTNENEKLNDFINDSLKFNKEGLAFLVEKTKQFFK